MSRARYVLFTVLLATSCLYSGLDFYRMQTTTPKDHAYPIFCVLTVIWCVCGTISSLVCIHLIILKYLVGRRDTKIRESLLHSGGNFVLKSDKEYNWKETSKKHSQILIFVLLTISCIGLSIDVCFFHLEGRKGDDSTSGIISSLDILQIMLYICIYHMTLLTKE